MIYLLAMATGTAFITNSVNGVKVIYSDCCCKLSTPTLTAQPCLSWIRLVVHQSACSGLKNQAIGTSRGGKNTKVHVLINERMQLINVVLTGGQIHDSEPALDLFAGIDLAGKKVLADKAYSCEKIRNQLEERGAHVCIPDKSNFKLKHFFDSELYKRSNIIERFFQRIKNYRHIAFRFDKLAVCFLNFVLLASTAIHF